MKRRHKTIGLLVVGTLHAGFASAALTPGPGNTGFWIGVTDVRQIDQQVARLLADHASVVALRMPDDDEVPMRANIAMFKRLAPHTPMLTYAWASRDLSDNQKPGGAGITDWIGQDSSAQVHFGNRALREFPDVTNPAYRRRLASNIAAAVQRRGADGIAIDLAVRTPRYKPGPLARVCSSDAAFCGRYAEGMDDTFDAIRTALGGKAFLYNGIWNFGPGSVPDQATLLDHADAAAMENFGGDFQNGTHDFTHDILPYVKVMAELPAAKKIFAFGRGPTKYNSYAEDYAWQRYLYCAFLLGAGNNSYFKYHATFRTDVLDGRTGSLSYFSDWLANLGTPVKPYSVVGGLYSRMFTHGMVIVAPDDGMGGSYDLPHAMYSPEGEKLEGRVTLRAGQGLLLLDAKQPDAYSIDEHLLDLKLFTDWPNASLTGQGPTQELSLSGNGTDGGHDMLLDAIKTPHPRNVLQLSAQAGAPTTRMEIMAEVDDPSSRSEFAILELKAAAAPADNPKLAFRTHVPPREGLSVVQGPALTPGTRQQLNLDGHALFANSGLTFRRWDYVRFDGPIKIQSAKLVN